MPHAGGGVVTSVQTNCQRIVCWAERAERNHSGGECDFGVKMRERMQRGNGIPRRKIRPSSEIAGPHSPVRRAFPKMTHCPLANARIILHDGGPLTARGSRSMP